MLDHLGRVQRMLDDAEHDVVRDQLALFYVWPGEPTDLGAGVHRPPEHRPGREVHDAEPVGQARGLGAFAGTRRTQDDQAVGPSR